MHGLARLIAAAAALAAIAGAMLACQENPPARRTTEPLRQPGVDGLVAFLQANREYEIWHGGCLPSRDQRLELMTAGYAELARWGDDVAPLLTAWNGTSYANERTIRARVLYADDRDVPAFLRRSRPAFPVGSQPMVATVDGVWMPAIWMFDGRWLCFLGIDRQIAEQIDEDCRAAYLRSSQGRCLDFTAPLAAAVLANNTDARDRLCTLLVEHGCGSVPAEAPPPTEP